VAVAVSSVVHVSERRAAAAREAQREAAALAASAESLLGERDQLPAVLRQVVEFFGVDAAGVVRRPTVRDPWQVLAATEGFGVEAVQDASVRAPVDDTTSLVLVGRVVSAPGPPAGVGADLLETIEDSTDRLTVLVTNLLDMSRLQSGAVVPRLAAVHLDEAVTAAAALLPGGGRVRLSMDAGLPPASADPGLLDRVLANVLENALRHSSGEVVVAASATADRVQVRVVDRGVGVPEGAKEAIFAPFQRFGDAPRGTGVGLGLAVARGLVEALGGTVVAEDTPGGGLTVVVDLPRHEEGAWGADGTGAPAVPDRMAT
jgi:signal transduction histidine kinase